MSGERSDYRSSWFAKKRDPEPSEDGKVKENGSHLEWKRGNDADGDDIRLFVQDFEDSVPSCIVEEVTQFCQDARLEDLISGTGTAGQRRVAWLDDRSFSSLMSSGSIREYKNRLTATELYHHLKVKRFGNPDMPDAERRLVYIADLDPYYIFALAETAKFCQIAVLRDSIWKHIAFQTSITVQIPARGFSSFRLELHLPYFALRLSRHRGHSHKQEYSNPMREWTDLSFLKIWAPKSQAQTTYRMYEAHISFVIYGSDERRWVAYAFVDTAFNEANLENEEEFPHGAIQEDPIASNGKLDANLPVWNPREYFLMIFNIRIAQVLKESQYLVQAVERSIKQYVR
ncbi:hypothetical protein K432DRAFT_311503 [Lepidopterella palustris CBS 459.81]|uniref:Uncharacterized protein n=1 Tax=Lepidopterella palustris CBS 459.81 TaxID=1314670 RepID=A0A8E2J995_9PEZI|nr:hypothetical protein K432DRAFT_311503 [Lepidopterella palustris CBS 459.81]